MEQGIPFDAHLSALMADTERQFVGAHNYPNAEQDPYLQLPLGAGYGNQAQPADAPLLAQWNWPLYPPLQSLPYPIASDYNYVNAGLSIVDAYPLMPTIGRPSMFSQNTHIQAEATGGTANYRVYQMDAATASGTNEGPGGAMSQMVNYNSDEPHGMTLWAPRPLPALRNAPFIHSTAYADTSRQSPPMCALGAPELTLQASAPLSIIGAAHAGVTLLEPTYQVVQQSHTMCSSGAQCDASACGCGTSGVVQWTSGMPLATSHGTRTVSMNNNAGSSASVHATSSINHSASSDVPLASSIINGPSRGPGRPRKAPTGDVVKKKVKAPPLPKKPQFLACFFCRGRKIACGHPPPNRVDRTCNQCAKRGISCTYPTISRRGQRRPKEISDFPSAGGVGPQTRYIPRRRFSPY